MSQPSTYDFCPSCGASIPFAEEKCPQCGRSTVKIEEQGGWVGRPDPRVRAPERSPRPGISGGLMLLMGIPALLFGLLLLGDVALFIELLEEELTLMGEDISMAAPLVYLMVYGSLLVGALASISGIVAIMRRYWWLAMIGAIVLAISGMMMLVPGVIGVVCAILLYQSRAEFA